MKRKTLAGGFGAALALALVLAMAPAAHAMFTLSLNDGVNPVILLTDGDGDGAIAYNGSLGTFNLNVTTGLSKPMIGGAALAAMDLNSVQVSGGIGTLTITLIDDGFSLPLANGSSILAIGGTTKGSVTYDTYYNATLIDSMGPFTSIDNETLAFSAWDSYLTTYTNPFSLKQVIAITHEAGDITSLDASYELVPAPEPGTIFLLGAGLLGLGFYGRRRMKA